jgi:acetyl-CoA carboxylase biotin carboxyl carrier protein
MNTEPKGSPASEDSGGNGEGQRSDRQHIVDLDFVRSLIAAVDDSGIDSLEISRGGTRIRIAKSPPPAPVAHSPNHAGAAGHVTHGDRVAVSQAAAPAHPVAAAAPPSNLVEVTSPMVGTFYRSPNPDAPAYVEVGSRILKGQTLCILEAMKLMNELESEVQGIVREVCVENSEPVEYGQVLFRIEPDA